MSVENIDIESAVEANKKLKETISSLENDGEAIDHQIDDLIKQREALIKPFLPLDDFKKALVDFVGVSGKRYEETIRKAVSNFAMGGAFGSGSKHEFGKPLGYAELTKILSGGDDVSIRAQLCSPEKGYFLNDQVFYLLCGDAVREVIGSLVEGMEPSEFGYHKLMESDIGLAREDRNRALAELDDQVAMLREKRARINEQLRLLK